MRWEGSFVVVVLGLAAFGCVDEPATSGRLVPLGAVIDQTGALARPSWRASAFLAIDHANAGLKAAGGFEDLALRLAFSDSVGNDKVALKRAVRLVAEEGVRGIVTDTTSNALALMATQYDVDPANDLAVPLICMACTSPDFGNRRAFDGDPVLQASLRDTEHWSYRTTADSDPEALALLNAARALGNGGDLNGDGTWKLAIYLNRAESGFLDSIRRARDTHFPLIDGSGRLLREGLRLEVVGHDSEVDANTHDWSREVRRLVDGINEEPELNPGLQRPGEPIPDEVYDGRPDVVIEVTFPLFAASLTRAYVQAGEEVSDISFIHHHSWRHDTTVVKLRAVNIQGHEGVSHAVLDNCDSSGGIFRQALLERTGRLPGIWDAHTYDATMVLALATLVAAARDDGDDPSALTGTQIRDALRTLVMPPAGAVLVTAGAQGFADAVAAVRNGQPIDYLGASGPVDFDPDGNVRNNFVRFRYEGYDFNDQATFDCVGDPAKCPLVERTCAF